MTNHDQLADNLAELNDDAHGRLHEHHGAHVQPASERLSSTLGELLGGVDGRLSRTLDEINEPYR